MKRLLVILLLTALTSPGHAACDGLASLSTCSDVATAVSDTDHPATLTLINGQNPSATRHGQQSTWTAGGTAVVTAAEPMQTVVMGTPASTTSARSAQTPGFSPATALDANAGAAQAARNKGGKLPIGRMLLNLLFLL